jgi:hypothetical protein
MDQQAYADGWKAGHTDRVMGGEPNRYSWHGTLDQHGSYSFTRAWATAPAGRSKGRRHE